MRGQDTTSGRTHTPTGMSATAEAFGAQVAVPAEGRSLFYVVGRAGPPDLAVPAAGGSVVTRLPDPRRVLAVAPIASHASLRNDPSVELAGPVNIDSERLTRFVELVGLEKNSRTQEGQP